MGAQVNQIFYPGSFNELFALWDRFPEAVLYAGGTGLLRRQGNTILEMPQIILCLDKLQELHRITRTEHYLETGSMIKLNNILRIGKTVPEVLCNCLENIGGVQLRNIATIGGNICFATRLLDIPAPLIALDAQYEFRNAGSSRWIAASRFHSVEEQILPKNRELLTRIRLPLQNWDYSMYKKFYCEDRYNNKALVFLAKAQKSILSDIRIIYKGDTIIRNKNGEGLLIGKHLPLNRRTSSDFTENWKEFLADNAEMDDLSKNELINCIEMNINNLSE